MGPETNSLPEASNNNTAQSGESGIATTSQVQQHEAPLPKVVIQTLKRHGRMLEAIAHHLNVDLDAVVAVQTPESLAAGTSSTPAAPSDAAGSSVSSTVAANATADSTDVSELPPPKRLRLDSQGGEHVDNPAVDHTAQQELSGGRIDSTVVDDTAQRVTSDELFDDMGVKITPARLSTPFGPFPIVEVSTLPKIYKLVLHCRLYPRNASQITGTLLGELFKRLTGRQLGLVRVAMASGVLEKSSDELCRMAREWIWDLCQFIAIGTQACDSLDMAAKCFEEYSIRCLVDGGMDTVYDKNGTIAIDMLDKNELNSQLILGIQPEKLRELFIYLPFKITDELGGDVIKRLKQVSYRLLNRVE
ncbi:hypothetical protein H4R27_004867 [Coemansia aciculifera]|nr:hypothetical protein H4R27_004867 [Coemansia aciculifera]